MRKFLVDIRELMMFPSGITLDEIRQHILMNNESVTLLQSPIEDDLIVLCENKPENLGNLEWREVTDESIV